MARTSLKKARSARHYRENIVNEDQKHDREFMDIFMMVLGGLILFAFLIFVVANVIGAKTQGEFIKENPRKQALQAERLAPIGGVPADMLVDADAEAAALEARMSAPVNAQAIYEGACIACHQAGIANAPKMGDVDAWAPRIAQGMDVLHYNAINGLNNVGIMPAKGGRADLLDKEVIAAVDYMVENSQ